MDCDFSQYAVENDRSTAASRLLKSCRKSGNNELKIFGQGIAETIILSFYSN